MNDPGPAIGPGPKAPYQDLYIYYFQGHPDPQPALMGGHFLGNWREDAFSFLFFSQPSEDIVDRMLHAQPRLTLIDKYHMTYEQWQGAKLAAFTAGRFFIAPPWEATRVPARCTGIVLDPGVVFGNGTHPTTLDCLNALDVLFQTTSVASAVDIGTGTGILALAAARLQCARILAVDANFLAARTAGENVRRNRLSDRILVVQGRAEDWVHCPADLLIANIHHDVMRKLIASRGFFTKKWFILSGLLRSEAKEIADRLAGRPVQIVKRWNHDGIWHTFLGKVCKN